MVIIIVAFRGLNTVVPAFYRYASINLCPNTTGQAAMSLMMNPPQPGDESYPLFAKEQAETLASLRRRAHMMTDGFNALEGVTCNFTEGAMYSFPRLNLPAKVCRHMSWLPSHPATGGGSCQGSGQGPRRVLLLEAVGGHRYLDGAGQRVWAGGGDVSPADDHPAAGEQDCGSGGQV